MWNHAMVTNLYSRFLVITISIVFLFGTSQSLSDKRLCADESCKGIISLGTGKINYPAGEEGMVSFKINSQIRIKSKSAGKDPSVWGIEVNGREGYAPKELIKETNILIKEKDLKFEVDVVKPGMEKSILSTSENFVAKIDPVETTTTKPLEVVPTESVEKHMPTTLSEVIKTESATTATPALIELVDGTLVPRLDSVSDTILESITDDGVVNMNQNEKINADVEDENDVEIGDYDEEDEEEEEEDDGQLSVKLNKSSGDKSEENILPKYIEKDVKQQDERDDVTQVIASDKVENSVPSNDTFVYNQTTAKGSEENEINDKEENTQKEVYRDNRNIEESIISKNSIAEHNKIDMQNENDEKSQELIAHRIKQIEHNNTSNEPIEKEEKEEISINETDGKNVFPTEVETLKINKENDENEERDLTRVNYSFNANLITNQESVPYFENAVLTKANESIRENLDNSPKSNNVPFIDSPVDSENKSVLKETNTELKANLENNQTPNYNIIDSNKSLDNVLNENDSNVIEINKHYASDSVEFDSNIKNSSIQTLEKQEIIYSTTVSPQKLTEERNNEMETISLEHQTDNQKEESLFQAKEDKFITTSSNTLTEPLTKVRLPSQENNNADLYISSLTTEVPHNSFYEQQQSTYINENIVANSELVDESSTTGYTSAEPLLFGTNADYKKVEEKQTILPTPSSEKKDLFATIMCTVNSFLSINNKIKRNEMEDEHELDRILFSKIDDENKLKTKKQGDFQYCKQIGPNGECPYQGHEFKAPVENCDCSVIHSVFNSDISFDAFMKILAARILEISELLAFLVIVAAASLFFIFGYYCFCNTSREGALLSKLNQLESSLLASQKENAILKHNLMSTRQKLTSIEDNSFGSNDMVVSLKKDLEEELLEKARLQDQITALQKELENAADAGIELNKIVSELLSNQTGDESIISSVEELQKQLNEQQNTILEINASLAEKSRENSELQLLLAEQNARYESELAILQRDNDELDHEKTKLLTRLEELKNDFDRDITTALEGKDFEIKRLQSDILELNNKIESEHTKWQTSVAKVEALEECLKNVRKDPSVNITELIDVANIKAQLIEAQRKYKTIKERLESEVDSRKLIENQLQIVSAEVEKLKQDFNQSEKDKLEAQTRLEVLSNYFKEKENQLQKELSLKEAMWLKKQGETTTTVDRVTAMQEEIQSLKSQNDSLRAEIEAQVAAHKAQTGTLENRAHETWLAARQSDRRYEEARSEATALRRKLTALAGGNINEGNKPPACPLTLSEDLTNVPSPIHMESPGSPMLGRMPPPPFLPPPFMGPPPPFIGMPPPPPFVPPGEMRPAPLGRIMSPPPQRSGRFSPQHLDYEDYLDYEGSNTWHRHTYSPPPRTYRSLSPTDSRYDYGTERDLMSTYDTETDFSPPPSPRESRRRGVNNIEKSDLLKNTNNAKRFNNKAPLSSGSEKSYNSPSHNDIKTKKGSTSDKSIV